MFVDWDPNVIHSCGFVDKESLAEGSCTQTFKESYYEELLAGVTDLYHHFVEASQKVFERFGLSHVEVKQVG